MLSLNKSLIFGVMFWAVSILALFPYVIDFSKLTEMTINPVLQVNDIFNVSRSGNEVYFTLDITKKRDCKLLESNWTSKNINTYTIKVFNSSGVEKTNTANLDTGQFILGPFKAILPEAAVRSKTITGVLWYNCHGLYNSKVKIGPFEIPER